MHGHVTFAAVLPCNLSGYIHTTHVCLYIIFLLMDQQLLIHILVYNTIHWDKYFIVYMYVQYLLMNVVGIFSAFSTENTVFRHQA